MLIPVKLYSKKLRISGIKWKGWKRFVMLGLLYYDLVEIDRKIIRKFAILRTKVLKQVLFNESRGFSEDVKAVLIKNINFKVALGRY